MMEFRITGDDAYELCTQMATLAQILDLAMHPWENPEVKAAIEKSNSERAKKEPVKEEAKPADPVKKELQKPAEQQTTNVSIAEDPVPAAQADQVKDYISHEDLQRKCVDLGDAYGQPAFQELKKKAGFVSMKKLDPAGRQKFADLIDQYIADHPKG